MRLLMASGFVVLAAACVPSFGQTELAKLTATDAAAGDKLGISVSISGNRAILGAQFKGAPSPAASGAAYIFRQDDPFTWVQEAKLQVTPTSDRGLNDNFGVSVAISGNFAVVGAWQDANPSLNSGAAYVFNYNGTSWVQVAKLQPSDAASGNHFGISVAIDGDFIAVGADQGDLIGAANCGAVYVFHHSGSLWPQQAKLTALDAAALDEFGENVSINGDSILVGARFDDPIGFPSNYNSGSAYVFRYNGVNWLQETKLTAFDPAGNDQFGGSISINADSAAVGSRLNDQAGSDAGAVYVYTRTGSIWNFEAKLTASDAVIQDNFGNSVAVNGDTLAVGATLADGQTGAFYLFNRSAATWNEVARATGSDAGTNDQAANAIALSGSILVVGDAGNDATGANAGGAYVFDTFIAGAIDTDGDGLTDSDEINIYLTDPNNPDTDGDGLSDGSEIILQQMNATSCPDPLNPDSDGDGLSDGYENDFGPNMCNADVDGDGLLDGAEITLGTNPNVADTDGDGLSDGDEVNIHHTNPLVVDTDGDGLSDGAEVASGTNPLIADTDGDGLNDGLEVAFGTNPLLADTDGDGLSDGQEVTLAAGSGCPNPLVADSDGDGLNDGYEHAHGTSPCDADSDHDGLSDSQEATIGTNPLNPDTDGDGLTDGTEVTLAAGSGCPSPTNPDSDGDGVLDGDELMAGLSPCGVDTDHDGLSDSAEIALGTDPLNPDTDGDGLLDGTEVDIAMGSHCPDPLVADSDGDGLSDGVEVNTKGTNPCRIDTDYDGLNDLVDPFPTTNGFPPTYLAGLAHVIACNITATDPSQFLGPNLNARKARRLEMAVLALTAQDLIEHHHYKAAVALLSVVENRIDDVSPPPDWITCSPAKTSLHCDVQTLIFFLDLMP